MGNEKIGCYNHLDEDNGVNGKFTIKLSMEDVVRNIESMNYGAHRFLSLLVKVRREDERNENCSECKMLTDGIEELLNKGFF